MTDKIASKKKKKPLYRWLGLAGLSAFLLSACQEEPIITVYEDQIHSSEPVQEEQQTSATSESGTESSESSMNEELQYPPLPTGVSTDDWNLLLVNRKNQISSDLPFERYVTSEGFIIDSRIRESYEAMMMDGYANGLDLVVVSTFRSIADQQSNYDSVYQTYLNQGMSDAEAIEKTEDYIALPNASEHSTGLAVDITNGTLFYQDDMGLVDEFDQTVEAKWLYEHAAEYGFILRYPKGKEAITEINYESWHFRYVGVESAKYITENNLTLEEYIELLEEQE